MGSLQASFNETGQCTSTEGSGPSANMYHAPLPTERKMCLHCRAGIMPCLDHPHLRTRYRRATECSDWAHPDVRATPLHALMNCIPLWAHCCILHTTCVACILVAVHRSAMCLHCPLMRWASAAIHRRPSEVQRSLTSYSHLLPSLRLACLPGRIPASMAPVYYTRYEAPPGSQVPGTSQVLAAALFTSPSN